MPEVEGSRVQGADGRGIGAEGEIGADTEKHPETYQME